MKTESIALVKNYCCAELPVVTLQRMCVGYLHNDWLAVASAATRLFAALLVLMLGATPAGTNA